MKSEKKPQAEFFCPCPGSHSVVLFIHGITEGPNQFKRLSALCVQNGINATALLLPGHGKIGLDFAKNGHKKWKNYVYARIDTLRRQYAHIFLVGHSMGALLAVDAYCHNRKQIDGIILLAAPLHLRMTARGVTSSLKMAFYITNPNDPYMQAKIENYSIIKCSILTYPLWLPRYIDLYRMIHRTRKQLCCVQCPILMLHCMQDEFVPAKCVGTFEKHTDSRFGKYVVFKEAGHFFYRGDAEKIERTILQFLLEHNRFPKQQGSPTAFSGSVQDAQ